MKPRALTTRDAHVDARPEDPEALVEVDTDRRSGGARIMSAADAYRLGKSRARREKARLKADGTRHERRTARHALTEETP